ncbi:hypothetical protein ALQ89_01475 [Pseudomonas amygdali pv. tabaci]|uniref:Transcriptional regulator n=1 Tax=Pseudomonas amygdali pv. tabaci TaxID=322 RepID=A0AAX1VTL7_PSEAJ|nr:hypothetical protein ALQ89_01475 [Pseudomonas amygdali pv. tabaci]
MVWGLANCKRVFFELAMLGEISQKEIRVILLNAR